MYGLVTVNLNGPPATAAARVALAVDRLEPEGVIQFGVGGSYVGAFLGVGRVAVASREIHLDTGVRTATGWEDMRSLGLPLAEGDPPLFNEFPTDPALTAAATSAMALSTNGIICGGLPQCSVSASSAGAPTAAHGPYIVTLAP